MRVLGWLGSTLGIISVLALAATGAAAGTTERVSVGQRGAAQASGFSFCPAISADGRFVVFTSEAADLVPADSNNANDVFLRDRRAGWTARVSLGNGGVEGDGHASCATISADGRFVAFPSSATNLVRGDTNAVGDIFVRDRRTGWTQRVSVGKGGVQANSESFEASISPGGRYVAFTSSAYNLVPGLRTDFVKIFLRDRELGRTELISVGRGGAEVDGESRGMVISAGGRYVAYQSAAANLVPGDTNRVVDVFLRDRRTRRTERVSVGPGGVQADGFSSCPSISVDGRYVAFDSAAGNLVRGDTNRELDIFVRDRQAGTTTRVSLGSGGSQGNGHSICPTIAAGARHVGFHSVASNLVPGDTNMMADMFVRDLLTGRADRISVSTGGAQGDENSSGPPAISRYARFIAFEFVRHQSGA